jgi:hypothetical protein
MDGRPMRPMQVPECCVGFVIGFAKDPVWIMVAGMYITGYYWALIALITLRSFATACRRGWN